MCESVISRGRCGSSNNHSPLVLPPSPSIKPSPPPLLPGSALLCLAQPRNNWSGASFLLLVPRVPGCSLRCVLLAVECWEYPERKRGLTAWRDHLYKDTPPGRTERVVANKYTTGPARDFSTDNSHTNSSMYTWLSRPYSLTFRQK